MISGMVAGVNEINVGSFGVFSAAHSSTLAWKIPWTEELGAGYCPWGCKE